MRYIVVGTGAIGGTIAGWLSHTGHDVVAIARGDNGRVIRDRGLTVSGPDYEFIAHPAVVASADEWQPLEGDVLLLAVKSHDSAPLLPQVAARPLGGSTAGLEIPIFCFQNGIGNEFAALRYFRRVHGVSVLLPATYLQPGQIDAHGAPYAAILELGRYPSGHDDDDELLATAIEAGRMLAAVRDEVMQWKSAKLLQNLNNALEALCSRVALDVAPQDVAAINSAARAEAIACFAAAGVEFVDNAIRDERQSGNLSNQAVRGRARRGGSTWQSVHRGLPSVETDFLNGEIVWLGRRYGIPTPVNELLQLRTARLTSTDTPESTTPQELRTELAL